MEMGMLWYDDDGKRSLDEKVRRAADYYRHKFGCHPTLCLINPQLISQPLAGNGKERAIGTVKLRTAPNVLLHHFWIGIAKIG